MAHTMNVRSVITLHIIPQPKLLRWDTPMFLRDILLRPVPKRVAPTLQFATDAVIYIIRANLFRLWDMILQMFRQFPQPAPKRVRSHTRNVILAENFSQQRLIMKIQMRNLLQALIHPLQDINIIQQLSTPPAQKPDTKFRPVMYVTTLIPNPSLPKVTPLSMWQKFLQPALMAVLTVLRHIRSALFVTNSLLQPQQVLLLMQR